MTEWQRLAADPRVRADRYRIHPTGYDEFVNSDKDMWCLTVVDGHVWGWSIRRSSGGTELALDDKGEWTCESRGSAYNRDRRWPLDEALALALRFIDTHKINGCTAAEASREVASWLDARSPQ
jgi:hypothetical protein